MIRGLLFAALAAAATGGCSTAGQARIARFNVSPLAQRAGQDARVAAAAAAAGAAGATLRQMQNGGQLDASAIGTEAALQAVTALVRLAAARAQAPEFPLPTQSGFVK